MLHMLEKFKYSFQTKIRFLKIIHLKHHCKYDNEQTFIITIEQLIFHIFTKTQKKAAIYKVLQHFVYVD